VGGQIGWNAKQQFESDDFVAQTRQALLNIAAVLKAGGAGPEHMVRMTWYVVDRVEYGASLKELGGVYREVMGKNFPAMTCVEVAALVEDAREGGDRSDGGGAGLSTGCPVGWRCLHRRLKDSIPAHMKNVSRKAKRLLDAGVLL
jgi:hypothetical protein